MNVLVLGNGGREHTIVWKLNQSSKIKNLYCIPGNGGISKIAKTEDIKISDIKKIYQFIVSKNINLVVVGPEQPLVEGLSDYLTERNVKVFGVTKKQAQLEGSKVYAKEFMLRHGIPTAEFVIAKNYDDAIKLSKKMLNDFSSGVVIKADGLAAGKGVFVCDTEKECLDAINMLMKEKIFGSSGENVVIERKILGIEVSLLGFCDGRTILLLPFSQDHKRVFDNDEGLNTGGMGAYSPVPFVTKMLEKKIYDEIVTKFLSGIQKENLGYRGVIYFGLIIENFGKETQQPYVLEFNCRFGDPETQVILPLVENDLLDLMNSVIDQKLENMTLKLKNRAAVCVILSSLGYPQKYDVGKEIFGLKELDSMEDILVFHSGTKFLDGKYFTNGGRVLGITALGKDLSDAIKKCYFAVEKVDFENKHFRKDIGKKGLMLSQI
jgi:phosphoribosylamine--glycine ligase